MVLKKGIEVESENLVVRVKEGNRRLRPREFVFKPDTTSAQGYESRVCLIAPVANAPYPQVECVPIEQLSSIAFIVLLYMKDYLWRGD